MSSGFVFGIARLTAHFYDARRDLVACIGVSTTGGTFSQKSRSLLYVLLHRPRAFYSYLTQELRKLVSVVPRIAESSFKNIVLHFVFGNRVSEFVYHAEVFGRK